MGASPALQLTHKEASDRGLSTHAALHVLKDGYGEVIGLDNKAFRLPRLIRSKVEHLDPRRHWQREYIERRFLRDIRHQLWSSRCCLHLATVLEEYQVTEIYGVEQRLPSVEVHGIKWVDTGDCDIMGYSERLGGTVSFEVKTRQSTSKRHLAYGRAMENAAGSIKWLAKHDKPMLVESVWVFYTTHPNLPHMPVPTVEAVGYTAERMAEYFERRHGGPPNLPFYF